MVLWPASGSEGAWWYFDIKTEIPFSYNDLGYSPRGATVTHTVKDGFSSCPASASMEPAVTVRRTRAAVRSFCLSKSRSTASSGSVSSSIGANSFSADARRRRR